MRSFLEVSCWRAREHCGLNLEGTSVFMGAQRGGSLDLARVLLVLIGGLVTKWVGAVWESTPAVCASALGGGVLPVQVRRYFLPEGGRGVVLVLGNNLVGNGGRL